MSQTTFRVASFNVENLFDRPRVFNFQDKSIGDALLRRIGDYRKRLKKKKYSATDKRILVRESGVHAFTMTDIESTQGGDVDQHAAGRHGLDHFGGDERGRLLARHGGRRDDDVALGNRAHHEFALLGVERLDSTVDLDRLGAGFG